MRKPLTLGVLFFGNLEPFFVLERPAAWPSVNGSFGGDLEAGGFASSCFALETAVATVEGSVTVVPAAAAALRVEMIDLRAVRGDMMLEGGRNSASVALQIKL